MVDFGRFCTGFLVIMGIGMLQDKLAISFDLRPYSLY